MKPVVLIGGFVIFLLGGCVSLHGATVYFDDFQQFTNGTVLTTAAYVPAAGPGDAHAEFEQANGTAAVIATNALGNIRAYTDEKTGDNNKYTGVLPTPQFNQLVTIDWTLSIQGTNAGWGGFLVNIPFAWSNGSAWYNPILLFHDNGEIGVYTNEPGPIYTPVGKWAPHAGTVMTNRLVLNYPARTLTFSLNGAVVTNMPIVSYFTNVFDAVRLQFLERFANAAGNRFMLDNVRVEVPAAFSGTHYVWTNSPADGPGTEWANAFHTIEDAINAAKDSDTVLVTNGTYVLTNQIVITNGISVRSSDGSNLTIVDGNNTTRCFSVSHPQAVVDGFTITRGYNDFGSGLLMSAGTVQDCVIISNKAAYRGAGVYLDTGGTVLRCTVQDNLATPDDYGGGGVGICFESGGIVRDSVIIGNVAAGTKSALGAGVCFFNSGFMEHSTVIGNIASSGGSSALRFNSGGVATNCTITQNISTDGSGVIRFSGGGALYNCTISTNASPGNAVFSDSYGSAGTPAGTAVNCRIIGNVSGSGPGGCSFMKNCTIAENQATNGNGGGLTLGAGYVAIGCMIVSNSASQGGGGVQMGQGGQLVNCTSTWNQAAWGGGVNCWGGSNRVSGCTITGNSATDGSGGGVAAEQNDEVRDCNVSGNVATEGGGIGFNNGGTASNCFISGNTAWQGGGVNIQTAGMIDHCTIVSNNACLSGSGLPEAGGVRCRQGGLVRNSLIARNSANNVGGGLKFEEAGGIAANCTIAGNSASNGAGGIWFWNGGIVSNSVVYGNQSPGMPEYDSGGGAAFSFSCTTPDPGGLGNIIGDPHFVDLLGGDFRLATNSPCIDKGTSAGWMADATDLDGRPRIIHDTVDMGAYEAILPAWDTDVDGMPDWWMWKRFKHLTGMAEDQSRATDSADGTGVNNLYKYTADLDPTNPLSIFRIGAISNLPPNRLVYFQGSSNRVYTLNWSTNLVSGSWTNVPEQINVKGNGPSTSLIDTNAADLRFYEVEVRVP